MWTSPPRWWLYLLVERVAAREVVAVAVAVAHLSLAGVGASSLLVSNRPASLKLQSHFFPGRWLESRVASVSTILTMGRRLVPALPRAAGEISFPGASQRCIPRSAGAHTDQLSNRCFLVDTEAAFLVFPYFSASSPQGPALADAAGQPFPCWWEN